ncbi:fatty acid--CoA ligase family protein [Microbacterium azadirachtae]|uniref:Putative acyl--CoA ligase YhfT n=1 Tax=Microbacterium azadirachtae TaxID=582680 RepID=A0A0F0L7C6_9MICO|nr:fatty acid--CoA ligase family protein [Microbacterium azadirachtae]KJL29053.1 putative acyl--CoA ligase YhfT [Microbacterium azadirachtae]UXW86822.1 fatty acid--CoA ligase family protein [Microbacterium azadirachtae]
MPITRTVLSTAAQRPAQPAIVGADGALDYAGLVEDSRRVFAVVDAAHRAQDAPPQPAPETDGIPVTAVSVGSAFHAARIVAGLAGYRAVSAVIDPQWPLAHRVHVVTAAGIGLVIGDDPALAPALRDAGWTGTVLALDEFRDREAAATPAEPPTVRDADEAFLLLFSSGTTSDPKAFLKTRRQYRANVAVSSAHLEPLPGVRTLAPGPLSYSLTLYALIECLATGGGAHLADAFDPARLASRVAAEGITRIVAVPAVVQVLIDAARRDPGAFSALELVVTGGANLPTALRDGLAAVLPHVRLISYYGAAEIGFIGDSRGGDGTLLDVYDGILAEIRDDTGARVPDGELGTLWIRAAACSDGYLAATTDAALRGPDGWATVHDLARIVDGRLQLAGRAGDVVATGGHKVSLPEVERAFDTMPGLGTACAVALPDPRLGNVVALVIEGGSAPSKAELQAWARARLAPQFVPRRWYLLDRLPRTAGGKIRRPATAALLADGEGIRL